MTYEEELLLFAEKVARAAGNLIKEKLAEPRQLTSKGFRDVVTDSDLASQQLVKEMVLAKYPDHGFIAEENDDVDDSAESHTLWIIDPIDGTTNYSRQIAGFCVAIGVAVNRQVKVGVVYNPMNDEMFSAVDGGGATLNGNPITVSLIDEMSDSLMSVDFSRDHKTRQLVVDTLSDLHTKVRTIRSVGSAALAICWVACGRLDGYFNYVLGPWDICAPYMVLKEAGGITTGVDGRPFNFDDRSTWSVSSNNRFHEDFVECVIAV